MRRFSPSATRSAAASISSLMANSAAKATLNASLPRSRVSISTIQAQRSTGRATQIQCPVSSARSAATGPWKYATLSSYAPTPTGQSRSRCPAHSPCRSRHRTSSTRTNRRWCLSGRCRAAGRIAHCKRAGLSNAAGPHHGRLCRRRRDRHRRPDHGAMAVGAAGPAIRGREPAGGRYQYRHRGGGECRPRRPHAAHGEPDERGQRDALRQAQLHFIRDIAPVAGVTRVANVMVINSSFPAKTIPEFIAYAKANPDRITMASGGTGSYNQMSGELSKMLAGVLTLPMSFAHRYVRKDAHYDPARPHQQHAILRHRIAKIRGLRHASGDVVGYRSQLDPRRQLGPDIRVERRAGGLVLERPVDGAVLIVRECLEGIGDGDELVVSRVLRGEFRGHRIGIRRPARNRQGAIDEYRVHRRAGVQWRLLLGGGRSADKPRLLFGVERATLLQHRTHAHHHKQHDVEAILCGRKARHGII